MSVLEQPSSFDDAFYQELLEIYRQDFVKDWEALLAAISLDQSDGIRKVSHKMLGAARTIGANSFAELLAEIEQLSKVGESINAQKQENIKHAHAALAKEIAGRL